MKTITHRTQQQIWEEEHKHPYVLQQMDVEKPSTGILLFYDWLKTHNKLSIEQGIELGCGKGRNCIWLAEQGIVMTGIDFSSHAISEAKKRAINHQIASKADFVIHDATTPWQFPSETFDIAFECNATTDIETVNGRKFAVAETIRVVKQNGYISVYLLSTADEFHKEMLRSSPAEEKNAFFHPTTGKFEKVFTREEILELYQGLHLLQEKRVPKRTTFFGKEYNCNHHWMVFQKI